MVFVISSLFVIHYKDFHTIGDFLFCSWALAIPLKRRTLNIYSQLLNALREWDGEGSKIDKLLNSDLSY